MRGTSARVGERLQVGDQQRLGASALKGESGTQRAGVVAEMERASGAVAGEYDVGRVDLAPTLVGARVREHVGGHGVKLLETLSKVGSTPGETQKGRSMASDPEVVRRRMDVRLA